MGPAQRLLKDLNRGFREEIVPRILPVLASYGLMLLGRPGVGKTPTAIILSLSIARHMIQARNLHGCVPGWRRSKQIDGFRERPGEVHVPVLLDDPNLGGIQIEDLKSFMDVGEKCLVDARYKPAKFERNQCRIVLNNEWDAEKEPEGLVGVCVKWEEFLAMFASACNYAKLPHLMAILKRSCVIIAGKHAVYLRLPSEHTTQTIHRFDMFGMQDDWLEADNKKYYGMYKEGLPNKYPGYDDEVEKEMAFVDKLLASPEEKEYIQRAESHERWQAFGRTSPSPVRVKEELESPCPKRPRVFGVIEVADDDLEGAAFPIEGIEDAREEDVFNFGNLE